MINLLPTIEKVRLAKEYQKRFFIVLLSFTFSSFVIGSIFLISPYRAATEKTTFVERSINISKSLSSAASGSNPEFIIKDVSKKLGTLSKGKASLNPSFLIAEIIRDKPDGVILSGFTYTDKGKLSGSIEVRGQAADRETLLLFVRNLEEGESFDKVDVPVSNFVSNKDIVFSLMVNTKKQTP